jgi:hypothetical protein
MPHSLHRSAPVADNTLTSSALLNALLDDINMIDRSRPGAPPSWAIDNGGSGDGTFVLYGFVSDKKFADSYKPAQSR